MTRAVTIITLLLVAAGTAWPDEIIVGGVRYLNVTITGINDSMLLFRTAAGVQTQRILKEVDRITLADNAAFNTAEDALAQGRAQEGLRQYQNAARVAQDAWVKTLASYRQLRIYEQQKQIDRALSMWRRVCRPESGSENALAMMPTEAVFGEPGSQANAAAIAALNEGRPRRDATELDRAITRLLLALYQHEGDVDGTAREAGRLAGEVPPDEPGDVADDADVPPPGRDDIGGRLQAAEAFLGTPGGYANAARTIEADLHNYPEALLARALLVWGKATRQHADAMAQTEGAADEARLAMLEAGLHLMYVATFFPDSPEAPEALFEAGRVNEAIGNPRAARQAYDAVRTRYGHTPLADRAGEAIERLDTEN